MLLKILSIAITLVANNPAASASEPSELQKAIKLYEAGLYESARVIFESLEQDSLTSGYILLCDIAVGSSDRETKLALYEQRYPKGVLMSRLRYENARLLFDEEQFAIAALEFSKVEPKILKNNELQEFCFKRGYCAYSCELYDEALEHFAALDTLAVSDYSSTACYLRGVIYYNQGLFDQAQAEFALSAEDAQYKEITDFYMADCEFNLKHYKEAIELGESIYETASPSRQLRLARIISEASLILGDNAKARRYFEDLSEYEMNRKDYFYAGSVLYSVKDYEGAISNYTQMGDLRDSLGQIAAYNLANSYLRTHNQVAAMDAFKIAAYLDYDSRMREDACFNYAKLAFDLNKDSSGFNEYISRYSTKTRGEQIYSYMALVALIDRDYQAALDAYDCIDELSPELQSNYAKANFLRGHQLFESGSYTNAIPFFRVCAYYLPRNSGLSQLSRYWMSESQYRVGNYAESLKGFTELYNSSALYNSKEGKLLSYNIAYSHFKLADYASAKRWFDVYIAARNPDFREDALCRRADCDFALRDYAEAVNSYQRVLFEFDSADDIYPYYQQALSYGLSGKKDKKLSTLKRVEQATIMSPLYYQAWYELARTQMDAKKNNEAISSFNRLKADAKDNIWKAKALAGLGMVYRNMSQYNQALDNYKAIVTLMPSSEFSEEALTAIESIYQKLKQPQKYLEYLEQNALSASKSEAEKEKMYFNTAEQLYVEGNYNDALAALAKFEQSYPQSTDIDLARFYMAESYRALGDKEKACTLYAQTKNVASEHSFVEMSKLHFAELSYALERYQEAYNGYKELAEGTKFESNIGLSQIGMMRSAYRCRDYSAAELAADKVSKSNDSSAELLREALYIRAKSCLALSRRDQALDLFKTLSAQASTPEGAEAAYMLIQNNFDTAKFDLVENQVYDFSQKCGNQSYWLARAYIVLADSFAQRGQIEQAKATYESIRDGYEPSSERDDILQNVNQKLAALTKAMEE